MKKFFYLSAIALVAMTALPSCSDDDDPKDVAIPAGVFTDANGLTLTVNGQPMLGKTVKFEPTGADKATLTISSTFDLSAIPDVPENFASTQIAGPGAIPGDAVTTLYVDLKDVKGNSASFSGNGSNDFCTYSYSGIVTDKAVELSISGLKLKDLTLAGKYTLLPYTVNDDWESDEYGMVYTEPIYANWQSTSTIDFMGMPMPMENLLRLLMSMPLLDNMTVTIPDMLCGSLNEVQFAEDGNIFAKYKESADGVCQLKESPANLAQYAVSSSNSLRFWLNPQAIMADATRADAMPDINNLLGNVIAQLAPMMKDGIPMQFKRDGDNTTVYLDTQLLLPLLKQNVLPLLRNEQIVNALIAMVKTDESMAFIADMLPGMISSVADVIENTTVLEIGLNLTKDN